MLSEGIAYPCSVNLVCILALHPTNSEFLSFNQIRKYKR
jgi:hypothetical protein